MSKEDIIRTQQELLEITHNILRVDSFPKDSKMEPFQTDILMAKLPPKNCGEFHNPDITGLAAPKGLSKKTETVKSMMRELCAPARLERVPASLTTVLTDLDKR